MERTLESTVLHIFRTRVLQDFPQQIRSCLDVLNDGEIWWRPNEKANSIGNLILHLIGSVRFYLVQAIGENEFVRDRPAEFAERTQIPREQLLQRFDELIGDVDAVTAKLTPEQMMQTTNRAGKTTTYAQILIHVMIHLSAHVGQIVYITKLLKEGAIDELWMKVRG
jgi:uncharacterized damage-inducible protein DinB